jgi:3-oxoacyl-[acyl-carrier protein] reductase
MDLNNKVIVITGAGQGLGRGMAISLAQEGANVALIDLNQADLDETVKLCHAEGPEAKSYITNVTSEAEVEATFNKIVADFGEIHGLVNNAGITRDALLIKADKKGDIISRMSLDQWQSVIHVNLTGVFLCGREAATKMVEKGTKGLILNICSISKAGNMGQSNYSAAKSGAASLTVTWAKELARYGIRVAGISPGYISTKMTEAIKPEAMEKLVKMIPLRRMGEIDEIAHSVVYLFENDFFNGRILEMDGGMRL